MFDILKSYLPVAGAFADAGKAGTKSIRGMCETRILTQNGATTISHCSECGMINIWHQNLMLCFTPDQFRLFQQFAKEMNFESRCFPFPDGSERLVLCTPHNDINFVFDETEWKGFNAAMIEALYMQEIYQTIYQGK